MKRTPLYEIHKKSGGKIVEFAGWEMPVQYSGVIEEHTAVRNAAGLFDVSHMGEIEVRGRNALEACQAMTPNDVTVLKDGDAQYTALLNEKSGFRDDVVIYRLGPERFFFCVNAVNADKDYSWLKERIGGMAEVRDRSKEFAQLALQGPRSEEILQPLCSVDLAKIFYYQVTEGDVLGIPTLIARTGYTGEDGFELFVPPTEGEKLWNGIMEKGKPLGLIPAGLGARDTLRQEMGYPLYGHELDEDTSPLQADLGWIVKLSKGEFIGSGPLNEEKKKGVKRILKGFEFLEPGVPRQGYRLFLGEKPVGAVTSGTFSPSLRKGIGMGYVDTQALSGGGELGVEVRGRILKARIVPRPFHPSHVKRRKK